MDDHHHHHPHGRGSGGGGDNNSDDCHRKKEDWRIMRVGWKSWWFLSFDEEKVDREAIDNGKDGGVDE